VIKPNFNTMTKSELRAYVIAHPNDKVAFHALVDLLTANAPQQTFPKPQSQSEIEEVENLIKQRVEQVKTL